MKRGSKRGGAETQREERVFHHRDHRGHRGGYSHKKEKDLGDFSMKNRMGRIGFAGRMRRTKEELQLHSPLLNSFPRL